MTADTYTYVDPYHSACVNLFIDYAEAAKHTDIETYKT